jgi:hypothetical protein
MVGTAIIANIAPSALEIATKRSNRVFAAYILVLVLTALIVAFFTWWTWSAGNQVQDSVQSEAHVRIQEAKATASAADERSRSLERDNLVLRSQVATLETSAAEANKNVAGLQKAASDAKAAQQRVETDLAKQQERAAKAENDLAQLKVAVQPRRLSPLQQQTLISLLSSGPKGEVALTCVMGDGEGYAFAIDVDHVLKAAGWTVEGGGVTQAAFSGGNPVGFGLLVHTAITAPKFATHLQQAFFSLGVPLAGLEVASVAEGKVQIIIGNKPPITP